MEVFLSASGRDRLIDAAVRTIGNFNVFDWFFGKGNLFLIENQRYLHFEAPKEAEVDPIDLIGQSGIIFSFFILCGKKGNYDYLFPSIEQRGLE